MPPRARPVDAPFGAVRRAALAALVALTACGGGADTIDRDVFVATYVDLRVAALQTDSARVAEGQREEILERHGVTEADLTTFAEVHAADLEFMRDVWADVEAAMDREAEAPAPPTPNG